ncbi:MAG: hypothetical protein NVSMB52_10950 [Chloroflexota bacterium]
MLPWYIFGVSGLTALVLACCLVVSVIHAPADRETLLNVALLILLGALCSRQQVYYTDSNRIALGTIGQIATVLVLPLPLAVIAVACAKGATEGSQYWSGHRRKRAVLVNIGSSVLAVASGSAVFHVLAGPHYLWVQHSLLPFAAFPALTALALTYYSVDALVVGGAITLTTTERPDSVLTQITKETLLPELSLVLVGSVFGVLWHFSPVFSLFIILPTYLCIRSFAAVARLREETETAVSHMARSVDLRDVKTGEHSQQLEENAKRLGRALGLTPEHVHEIGLAARAHDLGKIEISDAILLKPGPLTVEERKEMEEHPLIGANMLASYSAFAKSVPFVKHHHERWDGKGYPDGLAGEAIPVGSRLIAVVDSYDAMTADRPYRKGLPVAEAVRRLEEGMGSQFDPKVCSLWIQLLVEDGLITPLDSVPLLHIVNKEAS